MPNKAGDHLKGKQSEKGMTLLETMLALAVAAAIITSGIAALGAYQNLEASQQIQYNVNLIMQAMYKYYQANCQSGTLSPAVAGSATTVVVLSSTKSDLKPFLTVPLPNNYRLFTPAGASYNGYVAQFNLHTAIRNPPYAGAQTGTNYFWTMQVSVGSMTAIQLAKLKPELGAMCATPAAGDGSVYSCNSPPGNSTNTIHYSVCCYSGVGCPSFCQPSCPGTYQGQPLMNSAQSSTQTCSYTSPPPDPSYLAWEEVPAASVYDYQNANFMPIIKEFNYQFTNDEFYGLQTGGNNTAGSTAYYTCGS